MNSVQALALLAVLCGVARAREFQFENRLGYTIWVGSQGNPGHSPVGNGGFELPPWKRVSYHMEDNWAGRFWPRTGCRFDGGGNGPCETGDCGNRLECRGNGGVPPVSLAEITLNGWAGLDYYDVSLVDGFNIPISMEPLGGAGDGGPYSCKPIICTADITSQCPTELRQIVNGRTVACKSACLAFNTDQYCCRGAHDRPETCRATDWPVNYPKFFKDRCPDAYSYAYDDHKSTFTCKAPAYLVYFG